ncbi:MAG: hypothetical protein KGJ57_18755 [Sphingomonadales bacterium]|nr:hypothetical protein [Sphingomonadales bacterium]MDE2171437.1 hypothetical protein [Sphingomonadales bacterium]
MSRAPCNIGPGPAARQGGGRADLPGAPRQTSVTHAAPAANMSLSRTGRALANPWAQA